MNAQSAQVPSPKSQKWSQLQTLCHRLHCPIPLIVKLSSTHNDGDILSPQRRCVAPGAGAGRQRVGVSTYRQLPRLEVSPNPYCHAAAAAVDPAATAAVPAPPQHCCCRRLCRRCCRPTVTLVSRRLRDLFYSIPSFWANYVLSASRIHAREKGSWLKRKAKVSTRHGLCSRQASRQAGKRLVAVAVAVAARCSLKDFCVVVTVCSCCGVCRTW